MNQARQILLAVTGNPVLPNKSPEIFTAALSHAGMPGCCIRVAADSADEALRMSRLLGVNALAVGLPFQEDAAELVADQDPAARECGKVDAVLLREDGSPAGKYIGGRYSGESGEGGAPIPGTDWQLAQAAEAFAAMTDGPPANTRTLEQALELNTKNFPGRIALIGFMGCGKTRNGRKLSRMLGWRFEDMDGVIEQRAGKSIPEIFAAEGEEGFRKLETNVLEDMACPAECVVSCGGGVVTRPENRKLLRKHFLCVWLVASMDTIMQRTARSDRPLLAVDNPRAKAEALLAQRRMMYASCADLSVSTEPSFAKEAHEKIHEEINRAFCD